MTALIFRRAKAFRSPDLRFAPPGEPAAAMVQDSGRRHRSPEVDRSRLTALRADAPTLAVFVLLWLLLDRIAAASGSLRGEYGLVVCAVVLVAAVAGESFLSRAGPLQALSSLGLRAPEPRALAWTLALAVGLLLFYPVFAAVTGAKLALLPDALLLAVGMFAQGGVAEEVVFRGFLFRRLRAGRTFWQTALYAAVPFVAVHALLFLTLDFPVALAALLLALSMSFPLAWLFERSGGSVWPPAIVHAVAQGSIKLVDAGEHFPVLALAWMALCATAPWLFFLMRPGGADRTG
jgi:membrane protease YdiL (CAAX protease family)